jgi:hypothetical protein
MTEQEWLACETPYDMLTFLQDSGRATARKLRLFAGACCRRIWHRLPDQRSRQAVATAERFAEGEASLEELVAARHEAEAAQRDTLGRRRGDDAVIATTLAPEWNPNRWPSVHSVVSAASSAAAEGAALSGRNRKERKRKGLRGLEDEEAAQCALLRDIFGGAFRASSSGHLWRAADGVVRRLAEAIYQDRLFEDLPILADAVADADCQDPDLLDHLRGPVEHALGCWALDLILGKE